VHRRQTPSDDRPSYRPSWRTTLQSNGKLYTMSARYRMDGRTGCQGGGAHAGFTHATPAFLTRHLTPARTSAPEYRVTARVRFTPLHSGQTRQNSPIFESCLPRRRELDYRQLKTVADKNLKSEHVNSNCSIHTAISHRQDRLVVSGGGCELGTRVRYGGRCP